MNISLNWLKRYIDIQEDPNLVSEILTAIGLEVEGMEEIESIKGGLEGIVVGFVKECGKHPNADKLSITKVDIGSDEDLQIVCGAPNVAAGQKVLVATIGTTLYTTEGEAWKIKKGKIRGEASHGMICAEDELGLGHSHDGILVLPDDVVIGTLAKDYYKIENDIIYDIGLTPNRSDATAHIGVAKDLVAALKINHGHTGKVNLPDTSTFKIHSNDLPIEVVVENTEACPRYSGVSIKGVTIQESPDWLKNALNAIGVRPINNIVDITNFVLHEYGQPLHAFDANKISNNKVIVKTLKQDTPFLSLDEIERKLDKEDLMICDGESNGMCIAGVFGGLNSGVTDHTTNIFLESAHFNAKFIRRSSTRHLLRTDAAVCFEKGSDPNITVKALKRAAMLIVELGGGSIASEIVDIYPTPIKPHQIEATYRNINRLIGVDIPQKDVHAILAALEINILEHDKVGLKVEIPTNKVEVLRDVDLIEEILRIYGFNKVPVPTQIKSSMSLTGKIDLRKIRNTISDQLSANGFNEIMGISLTPSKYFEEILPVEKSAMVFINNTSNIHLDVMRPTMLFSGLEAVLHNQNRQHPDLKLYEFGKTYKKQLVDNAVEQREGATEVFEEVNHLSLFVCGQRLDESWLNVSKAKVSYFSLKTFVTNVLDRLGISQYQQTAISDSAFSFGLNYHRGKQNLVSFGKVQTKILKKLSIKQTVYFADFNWDNIVKAHSKQKIDFQSLTKYPSVRRDLALVIDNSVKFQDIADIAKKTGKKLLKEVNLFDVYENEQQLGKNKKSYALSFLFENPEKTLQDKEIEKVMGRLINTYEEKLGAIIRR